MRRALLLLALALACAEGAPGGPPGKEASMLVRNRSQYELEELRVHSSSSYALTRNLLEERLAIDASYLFHGSGRWYVTVFREKNRGGEVLAFTTAEPVQLFDGSGYRLDVFDDSFRLEPDRYVDTSSTSTTAR